MPVSAPGRMPGSPTMRCFCSCSREAGGRSDLDALESQVAVVSEHLQDFLDDLASAIANAAEDSSDGDQP